MRLMRQNLISWALKLIWNISKNKKSGLIPIFHNYLYLRGGVLLIFAIDFDGTLCVDRYPEIGEPREDVISAVLDAQRIGNRFILWTCRIGERLEEAVAWSAAQGIIFDAVNDNLPDMIALYGNNCRKVFADGYIDDRNVRDLLGVEI